MCKAILVVLGSLGLVACGQHNRIDQSSPQSTANATNFPAVQAGASPTAADTRPNGGVMAGAGGAGPGYDGSGHGAGKNGTVPTEGSGIGVGPTSPTLSTNVVTGAPIDGRRLR